MVVDSSAWRGKFSGRDGGSDFHGLLIDELFVEEFHLEDRFGSYN